MVYVCMCIFFCFSVGRWIWNVLIVFFNFSTVSDGRIIIKNAKLPKKDTFKNLKGKTVKECDVVCYQHPTCNSFEYSEKAQTCKFSNVIHSTNLLKPVIANYDVYIINPGQ